MKIYNVSQANETEAWLEARRGKVTGTKARGLTLEHYAFKDASALLEKAEKARTPEKALEYRQQAVNAALDNQRRKVTVDFWKFLAELTAEQADGENPMERGHRLEPENIEKTVAVLKLSNVCSDTGLWVSDENQALACSPDAHENTKAPSWAIECKSLGTANHLAAVVSYVVHQHLINGEKSTELEKAALAVLPNYVGATDATDYDFLPDTYKAQAVQYFVVNPDLKTLYFSFYDPRVYAEELSHVILTINREDIAETIEAQKQSELETVAFANALMSVVDATF